MVSLHLTVVYYTCNGHCSPNISGHFPVLFLMPIMSLPLYLHLLGNLYWSSSGLASPFDSYDIFLYISYSSGCLELMVILYSLFSLTLLLIVHIFAQDYILEPENLKPWFKNFLKGSILTTIACLHHFSPSSSGIFFSITWPGCLWYAICAELLKGFPKYSKVLKISWNRGVLSRTLTLTLESAGC